MSRKLISVDINSDFGFLKKPDSNEGLNLTFNFIHKPAILGILGAIVGLKGFYQGYVNNKLPEYFEKLGQLKIGIKPLIDKNYFQKTVIGYVNTVGYANDDGTLMVYEQSLIKPQYKIYILLDIQNEIENQLYNSLKNNESVFIPYLGKNEFQLWWKNFEEYDFNDDVKIEDVYKIDTIFIKPDNKTLKENSKIRENKFLAFLSETDFNFKIFYEELPVGYDEVTTNYKTQKFIYTDKKLSKEFLPENLYYLKNAEKYIQLN